MNHSNSNLTVLPAITPENVFEPIVNRHHAEVRFRDARRAEAARNAKLRRRISILFAGMLVSAILGVLVGSGVLPLA
ncbi:hypothetical protein [Sutterella wadsworthensis]|uniref:hypothetical protein n=1 Tax=Sutterella wadsworthensis TaxID=40545 RepID=UPI003A8E0B24